MRYSENVLPFKELSPIISSHADFYPYHYRFKRESDKRDGSILQRSKPLPNVALRGVLIVGAVILLAVWVIVR